MSLSLSVLQTDEHAFAGGRKTDLFKGRLEVRPGQAIEVAFKVFRFSPSDVSGRRELRENIDARKDIWRGLCHPNVVPFHGVSHQHSRGPAILSPYYVNGSALSYVKANPNANTLALLLGIAEGLAYLHHKGIIHGNLHAMNVLIADDGRAVLADYDLSSLWPATNFPMTSVAPETYYTDDDNVFLTKEADIFSFAMLAIELITRERPFGHHKAKVVAAMITIKNGGRPPKPADSVVADQLWPLLEKCWDQDPENRPNIDLVCEELHRLSEALLS